MNIKILLSICGLICTIHAANEKPDAQKIRMLIQLERTGKCNRCDLEGLDLRRTIATAQRNNPGKRIIIGYSNLRNCNLENTDLSNAIIINSNLTNANFSNGNLKGAYLNKSTIDGTNFSFINGTDAEFKHVTITSKKALFTGAKLIKASFECANLSQNGQHSVFNDVNLYETDFSRAAISLLSLKNARNVYYANFSYTPLYSLFNLKVVWHAFKNRIFS